jgi:type II secretory pathway component GspD/PulD (secretin)
LTLTCWTGVIFGQALEIIPLRHRTVEQVLPALQPLLEPGATLSGSRGQLFLRASAANAAEIKRALEAIDRPSKRLQISVRLADAEESQRREVGGRVIIGSGTTRVDATAQDSRASASERVDQRVQVLEGSRAFIFTGQSRPLRVPGGTEIQDLSSGFEVVPRLAGGQVMLDIYQQQQAPGPQRGSVQGQRLATSVTTRLGEWTEIGGTASGAARDDRAIGSASGSRASAERRIWLKVEELP